MDNCTSLTALFILSVLLRALCCSDILPPPVLFLDRSRSPRFTLSPSRRRHTSLTILPGRSSLYSHKRRHCPKLVGAMLRHSFRHRNRLARLLCQPRSPVSSPLWLSFSLSLDTLALLSASRRRDRKKEDSDRYRKVSVQTSSSKFKPLDGSQFINSNNWLFVDSINNAAVGIANPRCVTLIKDFCYFSCCASTFYRTNRSQIIEWMINIF